MKRSYYSNAISVFQNEDDERILGKLTKSNTFELSQEQRNAWVEEIIILKNQLKDMHGHIFFEFTIPRMGKRVDAIVIIKDLIFVLEFKVGSDSFDKSSTDQLVDYCLDLKNFYEKCHSEKIIPVLISTNAAQVENVFMKYYDDQIHHVLYCDRNNLRSTMDKIVSENKQISEIDAEMWGNGQYKPTPTIIEAAKALYNDHSVLEISRSDAGAKNLSISCSYIDKVINQSKLSKKKSICFLTGVPGAGKTLAGLNIAVKRSDNKQDELAMFLSGNGPLVDVLREALARDQSKKDKITKKMAHGKIKAFIQNIHTFRDEYFNSKTAPPEQVVIFDEAQRAWTLEQTAVFMSKKKGQANFQMSEPELLLDIMNRHKEWCTVVCLIGGGQEINTGEAGLDGWLLPLKDKFSHWNIHISSHVSENSDYSWSKMLESIENENLVVSDELHLSVSMRSFRAEQLSNFVGDVLDNRLREAQINYKKIKSLYPLVITRDLEKAKEWIKNKARGTERFGIVASSEAQRLRPDGVFLSGDPINSIQWYLNDRDDVRSSFFMEEVATEFESQGLEIDWAIVCWDGDYRYENSQWTHWKFKGTKWQKMNSDLKKLYLKNAYRVILTRARQGMVIYVPAGSLVDSTRSSLIYDGTYNFLKSCGVTDI